MPRPKTKKASPRAINKGALIRLPNNGPDEVVVKVSVVLHMANGAEVVFSDEDEVSVLEDQPAADPDVPSTAAQRAEKRSR